MEVYSFVVWRATNLLLRKQHSLATSCRIVDVDYFKLDAHGYDLLN